MREDITWRQTFIKILLDYYFLDVKEPIEVQVKTNEYRQENNEFYNWMDENVEPNINGILKLKDVAQLYTDKTKISSKISNKIKLEIEKWIKEKHKDINHQYKDSHFNGERYRGWAGLNIKNDDI